LNLILDVTNKAKVIKSLERNEVDFSLVSVLPETLKIDSVELIQNKLFLVANMDVKISKGVQDKSIFKQLPLIYREPGSGTRHVMEKFIEQNRCR
jgi:molybdate-binding protein